MIVRLLLLMSLLSTVFLIPQVSAQFELRRHSTLTLGSANVNIFLRNQGTGLLIKIDATGEEIPEQQPLLQQDDNRKRWHFYLGNGTLFSRQWREIPQDYQIFIHTSVGIFQTDSQSEMYLQASKNYVTLFIKKGEPHFICRYGERLKIRQEPSYNEWRHDWLVDFSTPLPVGGPQTASGFAERDFAFNYCDLVDIKMKRDSGRLETVCKIAYDSTNPIKDVRWLDIMQKVRAFAEYRSLKHTIRFMPYALPLASDFPS